jgi:hypothetical protein
MTEQERNVDAPSELFDEKPSSSHVVWQDTDDGQRMKKFDFEYLRLWASQFNLKYCEWYREDTDRAREPRKQHLVIFEEADAPTENGIELNSELDVDPSSSSGTPTPLTFLEIDECGSARIQGHDHSLVYNVIELTVEKRDITFRTAGRSTKQIHIENFYRD